MPCPILKQNKNRWTIKPKAKPKTKKHKPKTQASALHLLMTQRGQLRRKRCFCSRGRVQGSADRGCAGEAWDRETPNTWMRTGSSFSNSQTLPSSPGLPLRVASHFILSLQKFLCFSDPSCGLLGNVLGTWLCLAVRTIWYRAEGWECGKVTLSQG